MVMQPTADVSVGGLNPNQPTAGSGGRPVSSAKSDPCSNHSEHKLLTPHPNPSPPPPPKSDIQFQGIEASESKKSIGGLSYWAK